MGYLSRHWRGRLSLPVAFWVNNFLLLLPLGLAIGLAMAWAAAWGESLQAFAQVGLAGWLLLALVSVWAPVGAWRSASRHVDEGGSAGWALLAKGVLGLGMLGNAASFVFDVAPELPEQWRLAVGRDPIGSLDIVLSDDGRSVTLSGPFGMGAAERFEQVALAAPQLRRVVLQSPGGRLYEADEIARQVRERGLHTHAAGDCASACTLVFLAGARRSMNGSARLGFHRASVPSMNPLYQELANHRLAELYAQAGLPRHFVEDVLRTPAQAMWFPRPDVLAAAGILPPPTLLPDLDPELPPDAPLARYREALADNLLWLELDRRQPGLLEAAADRMHLARRRGQPLEVVTDEAGTVALAAAPELLRTAGPRAQEAYLRLVALELQQRRAAGDAACQAVFKQGDPAMSGQLKGWMQAALLEAADLRPVRPLSDIEQEVLRRELGGDAMRQLRMLLLAPARAGGCGQTMALVAALSGLRGPQRQLAVRWMLQPPG